MNPTRLEQIAAFYRKAHGEGMGYEQWDDATKTVGELLQELEAVTTQRDYGRDIINDMKLEAEQYEQRIEKLQREVFRLTDETLHLQYKSGSPAALQQEGVLPESTSRLPHAWLPYTEHSLLTPRDKYWIYNTAAGIVQHAQYCGPGTDKEALWKTHAGIIFNKYVSHYASGIYEPAPPQA